MRIPPLLIQLVTAHFVRCATERATLYSFIFRYLAVLQAEVEMKIYSLVRHSASTPCPPQRQMILRWRSTGFG